MKNDHCGSIDVTKVGARLGRADRLCIAVTNRVHDLNRRARDERGAALAEYGLLLALVALAAIGILALFGGELREVFTEAEQTINDRGNVPAADE